jgi:diacylglycerol kinase family enzyme
VRKTCRANRVAADGVPASTRDAVLAINRKEGPLLTHPAPVAARRRLPSTAGRALLLVVNGNASSAACPARAAAALRDAGARVDVHVTMSAEELRAIWPVDPGRRIVLAGGDGTVHEAVNIPGPQPEIAILPFGSANNVCRSLGIPLELRAAADMAANGAVRPVDLIEARTGERRYLVTEGLSVGFLAQARVRYQGRNSADVLAALRAGAGALAAFHPLGVRVTSANGREELALAQLFVANLPLYAFGLEVAPHADPEDATFDLVGIEGRGRFDVLQMLAELHRGTLLRDPGVHVWKAAAATVATGGASPIMADSTNLGAGPVRVRALPAALRLVRP